MQGAMSAPGDGETAGGRSDRVTPRRYMTSEARERMIVVEAFRYFAELGFDAPIKGLAVRLGISEPLIFRHFPTKQMLVERVHAEFLHASSLPEWRSILTDRSRPIAERIARFYRDYALRHGDLSDFRIGHFLALQYPDFAKRYFERIQVETLGLILSELRDAFGLPSIIERVPERLEMEMLWGLHGAMGFMLERRIVFGVADAADSDQQFVDVFLAGLVEKLRTLFA